GLSSDKWPTANGKVTTSVIKKVSTKHGQRDEAEIRYQYKVDGKAYTSNRIQFGGETFRNPAELVGRYKQDKQISIHYNPSNPTVSCLEGGVNSLVIIPSFMAALFFAFLALREEGKGKEKRQSYKTSIAGRSAAIGTAGGTDGGSKDKARAVVIVPLIIMTFLGLALKYCIEKGSLNGVHIGGLNLGAIPSSVIAIIVLFGGGLAFVFFFSSLPPTVAMLARAKKFKLAEIVARLNTALSGSQSYEAAIAAGLQAEIAQEQLQFEKALEYSQKALNIVVDRRTDAPDLRDIGDDQKMLKDHLVAYEKNNAAVEALCHESLGCILLDMGRKDEAMKHAIASKRIAQDCFNKASARERERIKFTLASSLAFKGRAELAAGFIDEARSDLEEAIKLRKELPRQYEENLATAMADLASTYNLQSETRKAERITDEGLKLVHGSQAPSHRLAKAKLLASLADAKMIDGHHAEAEKVLTECLEIREKLLVAGHPDIARTYLSIANLRDLQGKQRDAASYRKSADEMLTNCFGRQPQAV
ncbi:MAG: hypothetical protein C0469_10185, partial [Cyanobacteria bacterium DS2.3.42]|nr:hypothetical protein [Cyanobacteria bacterium DS2.3.42]